MNERQAPIETGWNVHGSDGERIGGVGRVDHTHLVIATGEGGVEVTLPLGSVARVDPASGRVVLAVPAADVVAMGRGGDPDPGHESPVEGLGYTGRDEDDDPALR